MNPDKLFDYLDGKLSPADRQELEEKLMSDAQLRAQFNIAREIHRSGSGKREAIMPVDEATAARGRRLGPRIATAAIVLVFLNVLIGLAVITAKRSTPNKKTTDPQEAAIRQQLKESLGAAAQNAMPAPSLHDDEINLTATRTEWEKLAADVTAAAEACGGSAIKDASDSAVIVTARIPRARLADFRKTVLGPSAAPVTQNAPDETLTVQIRIAEAAR